LTRLLEKRVCLHRKVEDHQQQVDILKSQLNSLQGLANIGSATCMIAHEINNLLTPISSYAALALNNPEDKALAAKALTKAMRNCERASKIMESILALANGQKQEKQSCNVASMVEEVFNCLCRDFAKDGITVNIAIPKELTVCAVPIQIQQVLMNLILNARDAMLPGGGMLSIKAANNSGCGIFFEVSDSGCGIKPENLAKIFEPFFSTKKDGKTASQSSGSGLGLTFCKRIVDEHGGTISVESEIDKGSKFIIILPKQR
jgi:signal transduction histidine kinase